MYKAEQDEVIWTNMINYGCSRPEWFENICKTRPMQRLTGVGMNCGCEYTSFKRFANLPKYSRYEHSIGTSLIVWNFTCNKAQAVSALLHDIATPVFAHTIDFLNGDYIRQESTESKTEEIIRNSEDLMEVLHNEEIDIDDVVDYHRYPIADNDSPRLSADRLEYTIGNAERYNISSTVRLQRLYNDLVVTKNENDEDELAFTEIGYAEEFVGITLACSNIYVADEDRYSMQILAEIISKAMSLGAITENDLYTTEAEVIGKLQSNEIMSRQWNNFRSLHRMVYDSKDAPEEYRRVVNAKKRYINPIVVGHGRISDISSSASRAIEAFKDKPIDKWLYGI